IAISQSFIERVSFASKTRVCLSDSETCSDSPAAELRCSANDSEAKNELRLGGISYLGILTGSYSKYSSGEGSFGGLTGSVEPNSVTFSCQSRCKRRVSS